MEIRPHADHPSSKSRHQPKMYAASSPRRLRILMGAQKSLQTAMHLEARPRLLKLHLCLPSLYHSRHQHYRSPSRHLSRIKLHEKSKASRQLGQPTQFWTNRRLLETRHVHLLSRSLILHAKHQQHQKHRLLHLERSW